MPPAVNSRHLLFSWLGKKCRSGGIAGVECGTLSPRSPLLTMSSTVRFQCGSCSQTLAVPASAAGKKVRCPKCKNLGEVPASNDAPASNVGVSQPAKAAAGEKVSIKCGHCQSKLAVKLLDQPSTVKCPKCSMQLKLPAQKNDGASRQPVVKPTPVSRPVGKPAASSAPAVNRRDTVLPAIPLGADGKPLTQQPAVPTSTSSPASIPAVSMPPASMPASSASVPAAPSPVLDDPFGNLPTSHSGMSAMGADATSAFTGQPSSKGKVGGNRFGSWVSSHRLITTIVIANLVGLIFCAFFPPFLLVLAIQFPIGAVIAGCLFLPRKHLMDRLTGYYQQRVAAMGAGGIALVVVAVVAKASLKGMRRSGGEFNPSMVMGIVTAFVVFWGVVIGFVFLWKRFGVFRVLASGYLAQFAFILLMTMLGAWTEASRRARGEAQMAEMRAEAERFHAQAGMSPSNVPGSTFAGAGFPRPPSFGGPRGGSFTTLRPNEIHISVTHTPRFNAPGAVDALLTQLQRPNHRRRSNPTHTDLIVRHFGSIDEVVKAIDFGTVDSVDGDQRIIHVTATGAN